MKTETKLTSILIRAGRDCKAEILSLKGVKPGEQGAQTPGWPDAYIAHAFWHGWIEFKGPATKIQGNQFKVIDRLRTLGVPCVIVRFLEQEGSYWKMRIQDHEGRKISILELDDTPQKVFAKLMIVLSTLSQLSAQSEQED